MADPKLAKFSNPQVFEGSDEHTPMTHTPNGHKTKGGMVPQRGNHVGSTVTIESKKGEELLGSTPEGELKNSTSNQQK